MPAGNLSACCRCSADVANLVLDGADGIVLGSETFRGKFAVACADTVLAICRQVSCC
jgi:pyruvate kinase